MKNIKLVRSSKDRMLGGVIGGVAPLVRIDVTILRLAYALITLFTGFAPFIFAYILCVIIIPSDKNDKDGNVTILDKDKNPID